ncbi:MAG: histidine kinase [Chitinophagaceae bacterium]
MHYRKGIYVFGIWFIPVVLVLLEAIVFLGKSNWNSPYLPYFITFWLLRALLSPLIVLYTLKFWMVNIRIARLFFTHVAGFLLFSAIFWSSAYLLLHELLHKSEFFGVARTGTSMQVFGMIVDNSISTNSIVYVSTVGFCYIWEYLSQNISINKKAMELERSLLTSRLELLKGQLNTHFLFNTLHTISSFVVRKQNDEANKMLVRLSELLRFSLRENKQQLIPLHKEMELLQLYLDIQETRFRDRLQLDVRVQPSVQNSLVPSMLLQPIVENAVKYGVEPYNDKGKIIIDIHSVNGKLVILVKDNGKKNFREINFNAGIGLSNTRERLKQLYATNQRLVISPNQSGQGVLVAIEIPNQKNEHANENTYSG